MIDAQIVLCEFLNGLGFYNASYEELINQDQEPIGHERFYTLISGRGKALLEGIWVWNCTLDDSKSVLINIEDRTKVWVQDKCIADTVKDLIDLCEPDSLDKLEQLIPN